MAVPDAVTLEERIFQLEKVFFTGLELLLGTDPENLDTKRVDALFDAYESVVSKSYESDEDFKKAVHARNMELGNFKEYVVKNFNKKADFDREYEAVRVEALDILLGGGKIKKSEIESLYRDLRKLEEKKNLKRIRDRLGVLDETSLVGNLAAAYKNDGLKSSITDSSERIAYFSQLCAPFLEDSKLANVLSEIGTLVTEIYFGLCEGELVSFSSIVSEVNQLMNSRKYSR